MNKSLSKKIFYRSQHLPIGFNGLSLGLCGLATSLDLIFRDNINCNYDHFKGWWISLPIFIIVFIILLIMTTKHIVHYKSVLYYAKDPLASSMLPTYSMTMMCFGGFIAGWQYNVGVKIPPAQVIGAIFICLAVLLQLIFIYWFCFYVLKNHKWHLDPMYGSWFVPTVGITTASTFCGRFQNNILPIAFFQAIWLFGFATFVILFPVITYSLLFKKQSENAKFPSIAVNFAPPNLLLASFCQTFAIPSVDSSTMNIDSVIAFSYNNRIFVNVMLIILICNAVIFTLLLYLFIIRIFNITKFDYIFASLTFPLAIGAIAITNVYIYFNKLNLLDSSIFINQMIELFRVLSYIFTSIASINIIYIVINFLIKAWPILTSSKFDDKKHICYSSNKPEL